MKTVYLLSLVLVSFSLPVEGVEGEEGGIATGQLDQVGPSANGEITTVPNGRSTDVKMDFDFEDSEHGKMNVKFSPLFPKTYRGGRKKKSKATGEMNGANMQLCATVTAVQIEKGGETHKGEVCGTKTIKMNVKSKRKGALKVGESSKMECTVIVPFITDTDEKSSSDNSIKKSKKKASKKAKFFAGGKLKTETIKHYQTIACAYDERSGNMKMTALTSKRNTEEMTITGTEHRIRSSGNGEVNYKTNEIKKEDDPDFTSDDESFSGSSDFGYSSGSDAGSISSGHTSDGGTMSDAETASGTGSDSDSGSDSSGRVFKARGKATRRSKSARKHAAAAAADATGTAGPTAHPTEDCDETVACKTP